MKNKETEKEQKPLTRLMTDIPVEVSASVSLMTFSQRYDNTGSKKYRKKEKQSKKRRREEEKITIRLKENVGSSINSHFIFLF